MKRKSISNHSCGSKPWNREDALRAIALEKEYANMTKGKILLLRFPDPEHSREIISKYSSQIKSIHFQQNSAQPFCFVRLNDDADIAKEIENLSKIPFGDGFMKVELKRSEIVDAPHISNSEEIDPHTLYIGKPIPKLEASSTASTAFDSLPKSLEEPESFQVLAASNCKEKVPNKAEQLTCKESTTEAVATNVPLRRSSIQAMLEEFDHRSHELQNIDARAKTSTWLSVKTEMNYFAEPSEDEEQMSLIGTRYKVESHIKTDPDGSPCALQAHKSSGAEPMSLLGTRYKYESHIKTDPDGSPCALQAHKSSGAEPMYLLGTHYKYESHIKTDPDGSLCALQAHKSSGAEPMSLLGTRYKYESHIKTDPDESPSALQVHKSSGKTATELCIKKETKAFDELCEDAEPMSLLGMRYKTDESQIKPDPDGSATDEESNMAAEFPYQDDFDFDEEYDLEPEEKSAYAWPGSSAMQAHKFSDASSSATSQNPNWEIVQKKEFEDFKEKPTLGLSFAGQNKTNNCVPFPFRMHQSDIEKLISWRRECKRRADSERPRDDLDDMFDQMNSDSEDEADF